MFGLHDSSKVLKSWLPSISWNNPLRQKALQTLQEKEEKSAELQGGPKQWYGSQEVDRGDRALGRRQARRTLPLWVPYLPTTSQAKTFQFLPILLSDTCVLQTKPKTFMNHYNKLAVMLYPLIMDFLYS